jgi:putative two-component system response regulator
MTIRESQGDGLFVLSASDGKTGLAHSATDRILIADDVEDNVWLLQALLTQSGYQHVYSTTDSREVMSMHAELQPDIVLLDVHMPGIDGLTLIRELRSVDSAGAFLPIVMLTGDLSPRIKRDALEAGASDFISKPYDATEVLLRVRNLLSLRSLHARLKGENVSLEARVKERTDALAASRLEVLERLAMATEARDDLTGEHTRRVGILAGELAEVIGLPNDQVELIRRAAPVHDIGKVAIPDSVLHKQGALNAEETAIMRTHTTIGASILAGGDNALVIAAERIAASHHERWDGLGYPFRLKGDAIPIEGRITAVADFFDALTHDRPYRLAVPREFVLLDIERGAGTQFDPTVAAAMRSVAGRGKRSVASVGSGGGNGANAARGKA